MQSRNFGVTFTPWIGRAGGPLGHVSRTTRGGQVLRAAVWRGSSGLVIGEAEVGYHLDGVGLVSVRGVRLPWSDGEPSVVGLMHETMQVVKEGVENLPPSDAMPVEGL